MPFYAKCVPFQKADSSLARGIPRANIQFLSVERGVINSSLYDNHHNPGNMHQRKQGVGDIFRPCGCDSFPNTHPFPSPLSKVPFGSAGCINRNSKPSPKSAK
ncbi:hypothetical protein CDAR_478711 [Caerostris darwini]|uniref:Uncharacterized protein n=1 Tax=Caerostris darwini TaxID=1538125 RepID=A0AAV4X2X2_9ARAC|nr:hypothetical protein CDAR_478711 [Caerostris darwini]